MEDRRAYRADVDTFFGPVTEAPVARVRDVIVCAQGAPTGASDAYSSYPPVDAPKFSRGAWRDGGPAVLARGVRVERLDRDLAELVMNACSPRGHHFQPVRQFGQRYSFVSDVDLSQYDTAPYHWDADGRVWDALSLSRWVQDHAFSTQYAARVVDYEDGERTVIYTLTSESKHAYRLRDDRDWLTYADAAELSQLLEAYWSVGDALPPRVRRAIWRVEYASWLRWGDLTVATLISGLESLLKTERHGATRQFVRRVPALAETLGYKGVTGDLCDRLYDARSEWVHGTHVRLFTTGEEAQEQLGAEDVPAMPPAFADICALQDVLRLAVRRCVEDPNFRSTFCDEDAIRAAWPA